MDIKKNLIDFLLTLLAYGIIAIPLSVLFSFFLHYDHPIMRGLVITILLAIARSLKLVS